MGEPFVKRAWWAARWPGDRRAGGGAGFPQLPRFGPPCGRRSSWSARSGKRPSGRGRGRTSLTCASGGRWSQARKACAWLWMRGRVAGACPRLGCAGLAEWSDIHPFGRPGEGCHDRV